MSFWRMNVKKMSFRDRTAQSSIIKMAKLHCWCRKFKTPSDHSLRYETIDYVNEWDNDLNWMTRECACIVWWSIQRNEVANMLWVKMKKWRSKRTLFIELVNVSSVVFCVPFDENNVWTVQQEMVEIFYFCILH